MSAKTLEKIPMKYSRKDVDHHPTDQHELSLQDKNECLKTVHGSYHDQRNDRNSRLACSNNNDEIDELGYKVSNFSAHS